MVGDKYELVVCRVCGEFFESYKCQHKAFCSRECFHIYRKGLEVKKRGSREIVICRYCGVEFVALECHHRQFCSQGCKAKWQELNLCGGQNPNWQNAQVPPSTKVKRSVQWHRWRTAVFERDDYTCQSCRQVGGYLVPHHIKSKQAHPELVYQIENGITLCRDCHKTIHRAFPANQNLIVDEYPRRVDDLCHIQH